MTEETPATAQELQARAVWEEQQAAIWKAWKPFGPRPTDTLGEMCDRHDNNARLFRAAADQLNAQLARIAALEVERDGLRNWKLNHILTDSASESAVKIRDLRDDNEALRAQVATLADTLKYERATRGPADAYATALAVIDRLRVERDEARRQIAAVNSELPAILLFISQRIDSRGLDRSAVGSVERRLSALLDAPTSRVTVSPVAELVRLARAVRDSDFVTRIVSAHGEAWPEMNDLADYLATLPQEPK